MSANRVASRYAKSLVEFSKEIGKLEEVKADMELFHETAANNRDFELMLKSPIIPSSKKIEIIKEIFSGKMQEVTLQFATIMARKGRESFLTGVAKEFLSQYLILKGIKKAVISSATPLDEATKKEIDSIAKKLTGKDIELNLKVNEDLIGGFIMRIDDLMYDTSVSSKLRKIERELIKS